MNKSEQLLSAFSEEFFFKDLLIDDSHFTPKNQSEIELADLIINLGDIIVVIQLKGREGNQSLKNIEEELKWLESKAKKAKKQAKSSVTWIRSGKLPSFKNKSGLAINLNPSAKIIPLVVFENKALKEYPHLLRKHSSSGENINCISFVDYQEMCKKLISPFEIVDYLEYRLNTIQKFDNPDIIIHDQKNGFAMAQIKKGESMTALYLSETYGIKIFLKKTFHLGAFQLLLHNLPEKTTYSTNEDVIYQVIKFMSHFDRVIIDEVIKTISRIKRCMFNKRKIRIITRPDDDYAILFVSKIRLTPSEINTYKKRFKDKKILEIIATRKSIHKYNIDFNIIMNYP